MMRMLCQTWGYTPEQALRAPAWLLRTTEIVALYDEKMAAKRGG